MKQFLAILLCGLFLLRQIASQRDFLSLSCGSSTNFSDTATGIFWIPDANYVTAEADSIANTSTPIRFFPIRNNSRNFNCYDLPHQAGLFLTRATFRYGNYDGLNSAPSFRFVVNQTVALTVDLKVNDPSIEELVWTSSGSAVTSFCLLATSGGGVPVISSLELRPLDRDAYDARVSGIGDSTMLRKIYRINSGETIRALRYPDDQHDRIWDIDAGFNPASSIVSRFNGSINSSEPAAAAPQSVLQTSRAGPGNILSYVLTVADRKPENYFIVAYFAMLTNTTARTSFDILVNGNLTSTNVTLPGSFRATSVSLSFVLSVESSSTLNITLRGISGSPEINALEVYLPFGVAAPTTSTDASSISALYSFYTLTGDHDPCLPIPWNGVNCSSSNSPEVEYLDISSRGLGGSIHPQVGDFSGLKYLNMSHNQLSGRIPIDQWGDLSLIETMDLSFNALSGPVDFSTLSLQNLITLNLQNNTLSGVLDSFVNLPNLKSVNIANNNFSGQIPATLATILQSSGNPCLNSTSPSCFSNVVLPPPSPSPETGIALNLRSSDRTRRIVAIVAGIAAGAVLLLGIVFFFLRRNWSKKSSFSREIRPGSRDFMNCKMFSYKELSNATNNFRTELGKGSFGPVYHGRLQNGQEVAIKVRSDASQLGADAFINEVSLLSRVHHQNLVELVGFCQNRKKQLLVYEFMPGGTLMEHLYGSKSPLDWKKRLHVAVGAASALDYLHNGSDTKIIHRDVKSSNILLDSGMNPKVADFGLSKHVTQVDATHVTTLVKGTAGYLDPEYYTSNQLTEKSDVYSFGVVLLELICGREPLSNSVPADEYSIINWAIPYLSSGSYNAVVDRNIAGRFSAGSMAIFAKVAVKSVSRNVDNRPRMSEVLRDLREAQAFENDF